jgi:hypothetical protein
MSTALAMDIPNNGKKLRNFQHNKKEELRKSKNF